METQVGEILKNYKASDKSSLIPVLQEVQSKEGYISSDSVTEISKFLRISKSHIFGVATFYSQFRFNPPGRHTIKICLGTACHVRGGDFLQYALSSMLDISPGETTGDKKFDLERVACLGCCALAPVLMIDKDIHSRMSVIKLKEVLESYE
jgi:NADH-quinone oxidoreductase subunit E